MLPVPCTCAGGKQWRSGRGNIVCRQPAQWPRVIADRHRYWGLPHPESPSKCHADHNFCSHPDKVYTNSCHSPRRVPQYPQQILVTLNWADSMTRDRGRYNDPGWWTANPWPGKMWYYARNCKIYRLITPYEFYPNCWLHLPMTTTEHLLQSIVADIHIGSDKCSGNNSKKKGNRLYFFSLF